ncbi:MAG: hypothetical protein Q9176_005988 [Flavoplaca citrina]
MSTQWLDLPNEIIANILHHMPDLSTLANLVQSHILHKQLFIPRYRRILTCTFEKCLPKQYQRIAATIQSLRYGCFRFTSQDPFQAILAYLNDTSGRCMIDVLIDPLAALTDIAHIYTDIEHWTKIFFEICCRKPEIIREQESLTPNTESPASKTELYRIRRAFWRFWLLYHLALAIGDADSIYPHLPPWMNSANPSARKSKVRLANFQLTLTVWEAEELECVYYFLQDEYERHMTSSNTRTALVKDQSPPIQRLLLLMGHKPLAVAPRRLDAGNLLAERFFTFRLWHTRQVRTEWSDAPPEAFSVNRGYNFYEKNSPEDWDGFYHEAPSPACSDADRGPVVCFLRWGYCIEAAQMGCAIYGAKSETGLETLESWRSWGNEVRSWDV